MPSGSPGMVVGEAIVGSNAPSFVPATGGDCQTDAGAGEATDPDSAALRVESDPQKGAIDVPAGRELVRDPERHQRVGRAKPKLVSESGRAAAAVIGFSSTSPASARAGDGEVLAVESASDSAAVPELVTANPPRISPSQYPRRSTTAAPLSPG